MFNNEIPKGYTSDDLIAPEYIIYTNDSQTNRSRDRDSIIEENGELQFDNEANVAQVTQNEETKKTTGLFQKAIDFLAKFAINCQKARHAVIAELPVKVVGTAKITNGMNKVNAFLTGHIGPRTAAILKEASTKPKTAWRLVFVIPNQVSRLASIAVTGLFSAQNTLGVPGQLLGAILGVATRVIVFTTALALQSLVMLVAGSILSVAFLAYAVVYGVDKAIKAAEKCVKDLNEVLSTDGSRVLDEAIAFCSKVAKDMDADATRLLKAGDASVNDAQKAVVLNLKKATGKLEREKLKKENDELRALILKLAVKVDKLADKVEILSLAQNTVAEGLLSSYEQTKQENFSLKLRNGTLPHPLA